MSCAIAITSCAAWSERVESALCDNVDQATQRRERRTQLGRVLLVELVDQLRQCLSAGPAALADELPPGARDRDQNDPCISPVAAALSKAQLFELGHQRSHRRLSDFLGNSEIGQPLRAAVLQRGQRRQRRQAERPGSPTDDAGGKGVQRLAESIVPW